MQFLQALVDEMDRRFPREELAVTKDFSTMFALSLWPVPLSVVGAIAFPDYGLKELKQCTRALRTVSVPI